MVVHVEGYPIGAARAADHLPAREGESKSAPFVLLLIDDEASLRIDDAAGPLLLRGLRPGPHLLRVVLSRPWGEVVKAPGALALSRIWVGTRLEGPAGKAAERAVWPDPKKPLLTCVFPLPEERVGGPTLEAYPIGAVTPESADTEEDARASPGPAAAASASASTSVTHSVTAAAADSGSGSAHRAPQRPVLDFFLSGATLKPRGRGDKLRLVVDKKELPLVREWKPVALKLRPGAHRVTVDLLDRRGTKVRNSVNRTDRAFVLPE